MHNILFLTLNVFSSTGGIEKVCRVAGKALYEISELHGDRLFVYSMHDNLATANDKYFPRNLFKAFGGQKSRFVLSSVRRGIKSDIVFMSHINLLVVGRLIKLFSPETKLVLITHGIEVWKPLPPWKKNMLNKCDLILPVSSFTKDAMKKIYGLAEEKFKVINNCLDPFLPTFDRVCKDEKLLKRYGLKKDDIILLTLSRLSTKEQYKGYDKVILAIKSLIADYPRLRYLIVGKYDSDEKERLGKLIADNGLEENIVFAGFIADERLAAHYNLADIYIMPSEKEGFGIVFIEAMFYGLPVIAGNIDGSADALCRGELGLLVNPENISEITDAIVKIVNNHSAFAPDHEKLMQHFSYPVYKKNLQVVVEHLYN